MTAGRPLFFVFALLVGAFVAFVFASFIFAGWWGYPLDAVGPFSYLTFLRAFWRQSDAWLPLSVAFLFPAVMLAIIARGATRRPKAIYGDARWATAWERRKAGLHAKDGQGVLLGRVGGATLCSDVNTHTLLVGPPRAGKGTGVVVPNCLNWPGSLLVLDVKGENYDQTAGFRATRQRTFYWAPMAKNDRSARFNPLDEVSKNPAHRVSDIQLIAGLLVDVSDKDPMWGLEARALFVAVTLFVLETRPVKTLGEVARVVGSEGDLRDVLRGLAETTPDLALSTRAKMISFAGKAEKEAGSIRSNLQSSLRLFENQVVDAATSASDFSIRDLRRKRMSVYVGALTSELDTLAPLLRLFFQQVVAVMSERQPSPDEPHKVLMVLDEFASLGKMDSVVTAFTLLASYNVQVLAVLQGLAWVDRTYGRETREGLLSTFGNQVIMTTNDETTTAYLSGALGEKTVATSSTNRKKLGFDYQTPSHTKSFTGRPLLSKQEVRMLPRDKQVVLVEGHRPTLATKLRYYDDARFKSRVVSPPEVPLLDLTPPPLSERARPVKPSKPAVRNVPDDGSDIVPVPDIEEVDKALKQLDEPDMSRPSPPKPKHVGRSTEHLAAASLAISPEGERILRSAHVAFNERVAAECEVNAHFAADEHAKIEATCSRSIDDLLNA